MQALSIQWRAKEPRTTPLGLVLAVAALLCASWVALDYADADAEAQGLQARQARLTRMQRTSQRTNQRSPAKPADATKATDTVAPMEAQLKTPWNALLQTLEQTKQKDVALLSLDAQAANRTLRLVGEAKSMEPALAYVKNLSESPALKNVVLTGQEGKVQAGVPLTRFALDASWGAP